MMLPYRRPPIDLPPPEAPLPTGQVTLPASTGTQAPHADYNLQPLRVDGLEHYLKSDEQDGRFRVT